MSWDRGLYEDETPEQMAERMERTHPPKRPNGKAPIISLQSGAKLDAPTATEPFPWIDMSAWDDEPASERKWAIRDRVPLNQAGLFSGEGGTGKSIIELMKNVAHVSGRDWLGSMPELGPAFYLGAEDEKDELHRRLAAIASHYGVTFGELIAEGCISGVCWARTRRSVP